MERSVVAGLPGWVGRRVVVRHLLPDGRATDALGTLVRVGATTLVVHRDRVPADGTDADVEVALSDVVLASRSRRRPRAGRPGADGTVRRRAGRPVRRRGRARRRSGRRWRSATCSSPA